MSGDDAKSRLPQDCWRDNACFGCVTVNEVRLGPNSYLGSDGEPFLATAEPAREMADRLDDPEPIARSGRHPATTD